MSDLFGNHIVGFPTRRLKCIFLKKQKVLNLRPLILSLRIHAYVIYRFLKIVKTENFQLKYFDIFLIFVQNIDCGYKSELPDRGDSNEYQQSMF